MTLETRAYLLDKLLPTLVPGVEKLLKVAERKKVLEVEEDEFDIKFDPINFLGEYLMRHNPAYDISARPNPYLRGMNVVKDELKAQVPETTMHKLAQMKNLVKEKRQHREEVEEIKAQVAKMRKETLTVQFKEWTLDASGSIPLALVQSALTSFLEVITSAPPDSGAGIYARPLEAIGTLEVKVNEEEFAEYVHSYIKDFTSDMFQELLKHLLQCSNDTRDAIRHDIWRQMFVQLFLDCDYGKMGLLDRQRILAVLETFYDDYSELAKGFRDPRKWPVIELDDIDLTEFWGDMEDDEPIDRSCYLPSPVLGLSEEALVLNVILKAILSDPEQAAALEASDIPPAPAATSEEEAVLEQNISSAGEGSETVPATASGDQAEISAAEPGPNGLEVQEDQDPTAQTEELPTAEAASEEPVPEAILAEPSEQTSEVKETVGMVESESLGADFAAVLEEVLEEKELGSDQPSGSEEHDTAAKADEAKPASGLEDDIAGKETGAEKTVTEEEAGEKAEPDSQEHPGSSMEAQPLAQTDLLSSPAQKASETFQKAPQLVYGKPWSGDLPTVDLSFKYIDYGKEIRDDWNQENSRFPDLRMNMIELQNLGPPSCTNAFNKSTLNLPQFVQLMETFVGEEPSLPSLKSLVEFVKEHYKQTAREKIQQLETVHHSSFVVRQQLLLAALFEKWDNECSGFLNMEEVDTVLRTFKEGMEEEALNKAKLQLPVPQWHPSGVVKLTQKDFQTYIELVVSELTGNEDEVLDNVVEFLVSTVERTHMERLRGTARRKWVRGIQHIAKSNGRCMEPVYQEVFRALCRDADAHGDGKRLSAYIALLEFNSLFPERGDILLRYVACTEDDAPYMLNQILYMDMKGVSFAAALENKPIHVPRVHLHGNIHFWNESRLEEERKGSFLVVPLEDIRRRVFGILGLDTLRDCSKKTIFVPHEIRFYQGVANTFSIAYHYIRTQENIMQVIITAVGWLSTRAPSLHSITTYFMEPGEERMRDYTLRKVMTSERKGQTEIHPLGPVISRKENIFRNYLFKCIDCAEVVTACVYEEYHIAVPLRDSEGQAIAAFDLNLGPHQKLPSCEHKDVQKALKMVQAATCEILKEDAGDLDPYYVLEAEYVGDWRRGGVLFYRFMLQDLQNCIWNLDPWLSFGEIRCFERPPRLVHKILKSVLLVLYPQWAGTEEVENWKRCIQKIDGDLIENICYFDPTASYVQVQPEAIYNCLKGAERRDVWRFGSAPIEYLYNWTVTCLSLIELAKKLQRDQSEGSSAEPSRQQRFVESAAA
ncbi:EF-hand calcium-binding domain-containing protein 5 [Tiliqua scincoides]|uniref:EF-hand calcium-binding domain-containing protein 5 n=1 Tax=Tiliqua scincoides TaxID=71010 RepID=UPI003461EF68